METPESSGTLESEIQLSDSINKVAAELRKYPNVSGWLIVKKLFEIHPKYAEGKGEYYVLREEPKDLHRQPVERWLDQIKSLYNPQWVQVLTTRLAILGLALLDRDVFMSIWGDEIRNSLLLELDKPLEMILSNSGRILFDKTPDKLVVTVEFKDLEKLNLSDSVMEVVKNKWHLDDINPSDIIADLLRVHDDYAKDKADELKYVDLGTDDLRFEHVGYWILQVNFLYNRRIVNRISGRHVILGLGLLVPELTKAMNINGFYDALKSEFPLCQYK